MENQNPPTPAPVKKSACCGGKPVVLIMIIAGVLLFTLAIGAGAYYMGDASRGAECDELLSAETPCPCEDSSLVEDCTDTSTGSGLDDVEADVSAYPSYTLDIGGSDSMVVPEGWYVSHVTSDHEDLTDAEKTDYITTGDGTWPIHRKTLLELTNGSSVIMISHAMQAMPYAFGMESGPMPEGYTVVQEPVGDAAGFARILDAGVYTYIDIFTCEEEPLCGTGYAVMNGDPFLWSYTFTGAEADLAIADSLYADSIIDHSLDFTE